ncbi:(+)-neomenthol dehydrogenase [Zea mays]|uniref:(+)-neomenthol dehydrogenase n=1 Tax=Zea mays TaxID=4577 RepID=A0A1D6Q5V8_MAIZE|nr:(+)-neomenthol dehydrogenase [Zea mays]
MEGDKGNRYGKQVAVVTGGNRGIGLEICRQLASSGVTVVLTARDAERGAGAASTLGQQPNVVFHQLDVGDPSSAARLAGFIEEKFGRLDILIGMPWTFDLPFFVLQHMRSSIIHINNAGITGTASNVDDPEAFRLELAGMDLMQRIEAINRHSTEPYEQAEKCLNTNYHGIKAVTKALLPLLQSSSHGRIVNLSSYYGLLRVKWPTHISIILSCKRKRKIVHNIAYIYQ